MPVTSFRLFVSISNNEHFSRLSATWNIDNSIPQNDDEFPANERENKQKKREFFFLKATWPKMHLHIDGLIMDARLCVNIVYITHYKLTCARIIRLNGFTRNSETNKNPKSIPRTWCSNSTHNSTTRLAQTKGIPRKKKHSHTHKHALKEWK